MMNKLFTEVNGKKPEKWWEYLLAAIGIMVCGIAIFGPPIIANIMVLFLLPEIVTQNVAGLQLLKAYMAEEIDVADGKIFAFSKGLHLYDDSWDYAKMVAKLG